MEIINKRIELATKGAGDLLNITVQLSDTLKTLKLKKGNMTVFVIGSTAAIVTFEYEQGLIKDMREMYEKIAPRNKGYSHDNTWGDANGFSHLRAAIQGPSLTIPFDDNRLILGTWQQVVLAEFDNRPRNRQVVIQVIGE